MFKKFTVLSVMVLFALLLNGPLAAQDNASLTMLSSQFNTVEEADKFRTILKGFDGGAVDFITSDEGPLIDLLKAESQTGKGVNDVVAALHGTFPNLIADDLMFDLTDLLAEIEKTTDVNDAFVTLGKMGTTDTQYYIPWVQATYVMAASNEAMQYLPKGADVNAITWQQLGDWCKAIKDATKEAKCGFPVKGLFHRFLEGYLWPSFTGGMVSQFNSAGAVQGLEWVRDSLWPYVNPESINYDFMNVPLLSGEVWVAFDHTARLKPALDARPDDFTVFPAPSGPSGLGFMPVVVGLGVPLTADDPDGADTLIKFLMTPATQSAILNELGFFPVINNVDMTNLPAGVAKTAAAVTAQAAAKNAVPSLLPVGLGSRGGEINEIFRNAFNRVIVNGEDAQTVLNEEGATLQKLMDETGAACWPPDPASEGPCQVAGLKTGS